MSKKSTKIIAAAGVVAGLGVAALPAMTFAANSQSVTGEADIYAQVNPAIAMTITGNNDNNGHVAGGYGAVDVFNPSGAASSNIGGHATPSTPTTVASSSWIDLLPNASAHGSDGNGFKSTITVFTNDTGFTLNISGEGANDALAAMVKEGSSATIAANGIVKAGAAGWGYAVDTPVTTDATGETPNYAVAAAEIKDGTGPTTAGGDVTTVYYGVSAASSQETGLYKATVTYTATTDN
ncbi:hypothetical protein IKE88_00565 [Candidatus Saccharibacteria bacterium]|nr:hypothetical protein [Candidatus Saccharibacteria bacterium]